MIRGQRISTLFPTRRSSDLSIGRMVTPTSVEFLGNSLESRKSSSSAVAMAAARRSVGTTKEVGEGGGGRSGSESSTSVFGLEDRKSTRLNSSHANISYAVFC